MELRQMRLVQQATVRVLHSKITRWLQSDDARQRVQSQELPVVVSGLFATRFQPINHGPSRHQPSTLRCGRDMQVYAVSQPCPSELRHTQDIRECNCTNLNSTFSGLGAPGFASAMSGKSCSSTIGSAEITVRVVEESGFPGTSCHGTPTSLSRSSRRCLRRLRVRTTPCAVPM